VPEMFKQEIPKNLPLPAAMVKKEDEKQEDMGKINHDQRLEEVNQKLADIQKLMADLNIV
jgi:hypothetical protein